MHPFCACPWSVVTDASINIECSQEMLMEQCARIIFPKAKKILTGYSRFYFKILIKIYVKIKFNKLNMSFGVYQPQPQLCGCASYFQKYNAYSHYPRIVEVDTKLNLSRR
jgi:hypothetical protein